MGQFWDTLFFKLKINWSRLWLEKLNIDTIRPGHDSHKATVDVLDDTSFDAFTLDNDSQHFLFSHSSQEYHGLWR